jgi:hypothetical protein
LLLVGSDTGDDGTEQNDEFNNDETQEDSTPPPPPPLPPSPSLLVLDMGGTPVLVFETASFISAIAAGSVGVDIASRSIREFFSMSAWRNNPLLRVEVLGVFSLPYLPPAPPSAAALVVVVVVVLVVFLTVIRSPPAAVAPPPAAIIFLLLAGEVGDDGQETTSREEADTTSTIEEGFKHNAVFTAITETSDLFLESSCRLLLWSSSIARFLVIDDRLLPVLLLGRKPSTN